MSPELLAAIVTSLPAALQLLQNMISDFQTGNSAMTEEAIINMQSQVNQMVSLANTALMNEMAAKAAAAASSVTQPVSG